MSWLYAGAGVERRCRGIDSGAVEVSSGTGGRRSEKGRKAKDRRGKEEGRGVRAGAPLSASGAWPPEFAGAGAPTAGRRPPARLAGDCGDDGRSTGEWGGWLSQAPTVKKKKRKLSLIKPCKTAKIKTVSEFHEI
ncbi:UNVERIFIED_CONTAM: hypothetical protein Sradi_7121400 [Sesamum radiatum]|uniref:Uncharacterized protein n=1 Tax=Sesamum radiatum TaxID=300843 RepID=A0AAW2J1C1_SESRA